VGRGLVTLHHGDCIEVMAGMESESVDAIVTDPPYGLEFMGVAWDTMRDDGTPRTRNEWGDFGSREHARGQHDAARVQRKKALALQEFSTRWAEAAYRVAKPSAYLLAFGGTRTVHRMTCAIEDAGWIVRDMLVWAYASGFPKSKASLKPAWEPIVMARKPGPLRMLAIDACRIGVGGDKGEWPATGRPASVFADGAEALTDNTVGRWPANVVLTDPILDGGWDGVVGGGESEGMKPALLRRGATTGSGLGYGSTGSVHEAMVGYGDSGTYSRFFLVPKAARSDREPVLGGLPETLTVQTVALGSMEYATYPDGTTREANPKPRANVHPTVKPTELMRHLVRLVTPTGGTVLDPFLGSGTTALAAEMEGFAWVGIEREAEYVAIAEARLNGTQRGLGLEASS